MSKAARFLEMKQRGEPIAMLTAYDAPTARTEAKAGIDIILVGDSVGTNMLGYASEREVTLADIAHHTRAVRRGAPETFVIADLPYLTYETADMAVENARHLREAGADMVKFEGPRPEIVAALAAAGIDVCGHLGLEPQHHDELRLKGRSAKDASRIVADAITLDKAGIAMLVLELIPEEVGEAVTRAVRVPTIGIGAGRKTDGQVLVVTDILGFTQGNFRHNRRYREVGAAMEEAARAYVEDVHAKAFPAETNAFHMNKDELAIFSGKKA
ncbi:MAG TPA: 3-methyl-2-oxobutanoate hydroxymethyltransferase [Beijerinckia sp.]|jgi:3-methyl-2-oxobutanoate hydroxymethyltransferase|nr:3-methyl-2-oxobutanoate hydroxymethyltransferase [Beijerinckia sp.]